MLLPDLKIQNWGRLSYKEAWDKQLLLVEQRADDLIPDTLVFCEHDPVITVGKKAQRFAKEYKIKRDLPVYNVERGGLLTYHGPGQLLLYPIFSLGQTKSQFKGVVDLIRWLEVLAINVCKGLELRAEVIESKTGVWIDGQRKIASIGLASKSWISYHGMSFNFSTPPEDWQGFDPCGFESSVMTDLFREKNLNYSYEDLCGFFYNALGRGIGQ